LLPHSLRPSRNSATRTRSFHEVVYSNVVSYYSLNLIDSRVDMTDTVVQICQIAFLKARSKFGLSTRTPTAWEEDKAEQLLRCAEDLVLNDGVINVQETLDFDEDANEYEDGDFCGDSIEGPKSPDADSPLESDSKHSSQDWETLEIDNQKFTTSK